MYGGNGMTYIKRFAILRAVHQKTCIYCRHLKMSTALLCSFRQAIIVSKNIHKYVPITFEMYASEMCNS